MFTARQKQIQQFISDFKTRSGKKPEVETVASLNKRLKKEANHEIWRTCNACGDHFDLRMQLEQNCPTCGSYDLKCG